MSFVSTAGARIPHISVPPIFYAPLSPTTQDADTITPLASSAPFEISYISYSGGWANVTPALLVDSGFRWNTLPAGKLDVNDAAYTGVAFTLYLEADFVKNAVSGTGDNVSFFRYTNVSNGVEIGVRVVSDVPTISVTTTVGGSAATTFYGAIDATNFRMVFDADGTTISFYMGATLVTTRSISRATLQDGSLIATGRGYPTAGGTAGIQTYKFREAKLYL